MEIAKVAQALQLKKLYLILPAMAIVFGIYGVKRDISAAGKYGAIDLRNRIVGSRVLALKKSPYFFKWDQRYSDKLLDPLDNPVFKVNRLTVPPTLLAFDLVFSWMEYSTAKWAWFVFQYFCLFYLLISSLKYLKDGYSKITYLTVTSLFILSAPFWHLHVERGQVYVLYALMLWISYRLYTSSYRRKEVLAGLVLGLLISLRSPFVLFLFPFAVFRQFKFVSGAAAGALLGVILSSIIVGPSTWVDYFRAMSIWSQMQIKGDVFLGYEHKVIYPAIVEGFHNLTVLKGTFSYNSSIQLLCYRLGTVLTSKYLIILYLLTISVILRLVYSKATSVEMLFLAGFLIYIVFEYFAPAPRFSYNLIQWLFPLTLIFIVARKRQQVALACIFSGLLLQISMQLFPYVLLSDLLLIVGTIYFIRSYQQDRQVNDLRGGQLMHISPIW